MKKVYYLLLLTLLFSKGCFLSKEYPVEYDYNFLGEFDKYKSFDFVMTSKSLPDEQNDLIKSTIKSHLELLGYEFDTENPSFYVNYMYLGDSLKYRGYDQPNMQNFLLFQDKDDKKKEEYYEKDLYINEGTLIINFTETSDYSMVWQGYTTDLYAENIFDDPRKVRVAVLSILNNFSHIPERKNN